MESTVSHSVVESLARPQLWVGCVSKPFYSKTQKLQGAVRQYFGWYTLNCWTETVALHLSNTNSPISSSARELGCIVIGWEDYKYQAPFFSHFVYSDK